MIAALIGRYVLRVSDDRRNTSSSPFIEDDSLINLCQTFYSNKEGLFRLRAGAFRLFSVDFVEHGFQLLFESFVFGALVEFTDKMASDLESVISKVEG